MRKQMPEMDKSLLEVNASVDTSKPKSKWKRFFAFLGPAYLVSVGYMDPGNWATDLAGGSQFGYKLLWVLLMSNLMALLLQSLSARLGIVRGRDLAQANKEYYPKYVNYILYFLAEIAIAATDLAEVLGMAIGIQLLTGMPLLWAVGLTALDTFIILLLQRFGIRKLEAFIIALIAIIGISFFIEIYLAKPNPSEIVKGFVPSIPNDTALYIAIGIIGATVMPHNLYLHSALVQTRKIKQDTESIKKAIKYNFIDSLIALNLALFVNAGILILAASSFHATGQTHVAEIGEAYKLLGSTLGNDYAPYLFAIALIAAGQSSTITGTLSGQIVMEGYLNWRIAPMVRRLITRLIAIVPAVIVIWINGDKKVDDLLIFSQVILSFQLAFAIIPLIHFVSDKQKMKNFAIKKLTKIVAWLITAILVFLNAKMIWDMSLEYIQSSNNHIYIALIILAGIFFLGLLLFIIIYRPKYKPVPISVHQPRRLLSKTTLPAYKRVAVALDFSPADDELIAHALQQKSSDATLILLHIVESPATQILENNINDYEANEDKKTLEEYALQLKEMGINNEIYLGYHDRVKELIRLIEESNAGLLIMGAHRHKLAKDWLYGETISSVRHHIKIPLLIVQVS